MITAAESTGPTEAKIVAAEELRLGMPYEIRKNHPDLKVAIVLPNH